MGSPNDGRGGSPPSPGYSLMCDMNGRLIRRQARPPGETNVEWAHVLLIDDDRPNCASVVDEGGLAVEFCIHEEGPDLFLLEMLEDMYTQTNRQPSPNTLYTTPQRPKLAKV